MVDRRQKQGNHTWEIIIDYVKCPHCGYILENRKKYEKQSGEYVRDFTCPCCKESFTITRQRPPNWPALLLD